MLTSVKALAMLEDLIATGATFDPAGTWLTIFSGLVNNGPDTITADLTEPVLADYPRKALTTWGTPYLLAGGSAVVDSAIKVYAPPDNTHPFSILGFALVDAATAGALIEFVILPTPVNLVVTTDHWSISVRLTVDVNGVWDVSINWDG